MSKKRVYEKPCCEIVISNYHDSIMEGWGVNASRTTEGWAKPEPLQTDEDFNLWDDAQATGGTVRQRDFWSDDIDANDPNITLDW